jgi:hypothetical protein
MRAGERFTSRPLNFNRPPARAEVNSEAVRNPGAAVTNPVRGRAATFDGLAANGPGSTNGSGTRIARTIPIPA